MNMGGKGEQHSTAMEIDDKQNGEADAVTMDSDINMPDNDQVAEVAMDTDIDMPQNEEVTTPFVANMPDDEEIGASNAVEALRKLEHNSAMAISLKEANNNSNDNGDANGPETEPATPAAAVAPLSVESGSIVPFAGEPEGASASGSAMEIEMSPNNIGKLDGWEAARAWLMTLPRRRNVDANEIDEWLKNNRNSLSRDIVTLPRAHLHRYLVSQHKLIRKADQQPDSPKCQAEVAEWLEPPTARFKRSDKWRPVYTWLESLDVREVVKTKQIDEWLTDNPEIRDELQSKHSRYHLIHYIQKCHTKIIKKKQKSVDGDPGNKQKPANGATGERKKMSADQQHRKNNMSLIEMEKSHGTLAADETQNTTSYFSKDMKSCYTGQVHGNGVITAMDTGDAANDKFQGPGHMSPAKAEAFRKYELLAELENRLIALISKSKQVTASTLTATGEKNAIQPVEANDDSEGRSRRRLRDSFQSQHDQANQSSIGQVRARLIADVKSGRKRKKAKVSMYAWARCQTSSDGCSTSENGSIIQSSNDHTEGAIKNDSARQCLSNIIKCLQGQEAGISWPLRSTSMWHVEKRPKKWKSLLQGWESLDKQFESPATWLERKAFSSWIPTWSAYTSSVAVAQPLGIMDQAVQKVLDVRFHPHGLPQLVCSSNEAPNELLLYNLKAGRATELAGHNCQIQAVEYAVGGASIVSCGSNLVKVWDSTSGACLFTMGATTETAASVGHKKKINAMTVNKWQSCLVATSGCDGDGQLLLWNVLLGELAADINASMRQKHAILPAIDAMEFCNQNLLVCGSDSAYGGPAIVQLWDIEATQGCASFPAHDSYITSLKSNLTGNILITGAGDGTIGLFDIRTCGGISRLSVGMDLEVTSVSFSSCGTYFHASSTANCTFVWDTRMIPMERGAMPTERPLPVTEQRVQSMRPLHCLSHGEPMPTAENAGQLPGYVDEGDQGVNDARWFHDAPLLVTASGNGSIAMWDVTLGNPCVRHINSHTRCVNTVAIAPNDEYICSGGDDQKVVLYHDSNAILSTNWRLTHPLVDVQAALPVV